MAIEVDQFSRRSPPPRGAVAQTSPGRRSRRRSCTIGPPVAGASRATSTRKPAPSAVQVGRTSDRNRRGTWNGWRRAAIAGRHSPHPERYTFDVQMIGIHRARLRSRRRRGVARNRAPPMRRIRVPAMSPHSFPFVSGAPGPAGRTREGPATSRPTRPMRRLPSTRAAGRGETSEPGPPRSPLATRRGRHQVKTGSAPSRRCPAQSWPSPERTSQPPHRQSSRCRVANGPPAGAGAADTEGPARPWPAASGGGSAGARRATARARAVPPRPPRTTGPVGTRPRVRHVEGDTGADQSRRRRAPAGRVPRQARAPSACGCAVARRVPLTGDRGRGRSAARVAVARHHGAVDRGGAGTL